MARASEAPMTPLHQFGGRCWCGKRHRVYTLPRTRAPRKPRARPAYWGCYETAEQCDREQLAVCLMQMESDGEVECVQTPRGEAWRNVTVEEQP